MRKQELLKPGLQRPSWCYWILSTASVNTHEPAVTGRRRTVVSDQGSVGLADWYHQ